MQVNKEIKMQLSLSIDEACIATGIGRTKLYEAINKGLLPPRHFPDTQGIDFIACSGAIVFLRAVGVFFAALMRDEILWHGHKPFVHDKIKAVIKAAYALQRRFV